MGFTGHFDSAILVIAVLTSLLASGALFVSLWHRNATLSPPQPATAELPSTDATKKPPTTEDSDSSESDDDAKKKEDDKITHELIDDAYKVIHQRYLRKEYKWEDFDPAKEKVHEGVVFIVYHRHMDMITPSTRSVERYVEVHSDQLKDVLRGCLKHVDTVFDPTPLIDVKKLYSAEEQLKEELERLQGELKIAEEAEKEQAEESAEATAKNTEGESATTETTQESSAPLVNGHIEKVKIIDGDSSSDNETTAVNTPLGASTPLPKADATPQTTETAAVGEADEKTTVISLRTQALHLQKLLTFIDNDFSTLRNKLNELLANNEIKFDLLWCVFRLGKVISFRDYESGLMMAGEITAANYLRRGADSQEYFEVCARYIDYNGSCFYSAWQRMEIPFFKDLRKIRALPMQPLDDNAELKQHLKARGADFVRLKGTHYLEYHDSLYQRRNFGLESRILKFRAEGRAMVDCASYQKMNPTASFPDPDDEEKIDDVPEEKLHFCAPTVFGYSFVTKMWGRLVADKFTPIIWNKMAFEHLVLPEATKTLIKSLVDADRANADIIKDVISGKGGGCIVILHGRPGTGKTLTAEAIAEERQKPLMVISVGELGQDASELETKLTDILEISKLWEAVLLLDEADVFLEARSLHELHRNAMVGVFLRLLEYHQRIMFLTTNRVTSLDEAFKSRISIAIKYRDLDKDARRQVWENFLHLAGVKIVDGTVNGYDESVASITGADVNKLASHRLNGREIKNITRTAQALALSVHKPLGYDLLKQVLDVGAQFEKDFKEHDTLGMYAARGEDLRDHHRLYQ